MTRTIITFEIDSLAPLHFIGGTEERVCNSAFRQAPQPMGAECPVDDMRDSTSLARVVGGSFADFIVRGA